MLLWQDCPTLLISCRFSFQPLFGTPNSTNCSSSRRSLTVNEVSFAKVVKKTGRQISRNRVGQPRFMIFKRSPVLPVQSLPCQEQIYNQHMAVISIGFSQLPSKLQQGWRLKGLGHGYSNLDLESKSGPGFLSPQVIN
uniref:Uncharacterized protein n=1 Tax=Anguilla anguilla TaxID=7936 RepID=A0A0E9XEQ2_ANGAN